MSAGTLNLSRRQWNNIISMLVSYNGDRSPSVRLMEMEN
jgi:hypothetical protein